MEKKLPTYEMLLDDVDFNSITAMSLVNDPAIESDFMLFSKDDKLSLAKVDELKGIVTGPALIPEKLIYRNNGVEEFYVKFSKETVRDIAQNFFKGHNHDSITIDHMYNANNIYVFESWIKESEEDKSVALGLDVPIGTWLITAKIDNKEVLEQVKNGDLNGFSLEAYLSKRLVKMGSEKEIDEMDEIELEALYNDLVQIINNNK